MEMPMNRSTEHIAGTLSRHGAALAVLALTAVLTLPAVADDHQELHGRQQQANLESFDQVWTTIRDHHFQKNPGNLDWNKVREDMRPKVAAATSMDEAREVMQGMLEMLGQSHFNIIPATLYADMDLPDGPDSRDGRAGLDVRVVDDSVLVTRVAPGSSAAAVGIRAGWEIIAIEGTLLKPLIRRVRQQFQEASWEAGTLSGMAGSRLRGKPGQAIKVTFRDGGNNHRVTRLALHAQEGEKFQFGYLPPVRVHLSSGRHEDEIQWVALNMFLDPGRIMPGFNQAMEEAMDAAGLIIDIRGNPGGLPGMVSGMLGWLIQERTGELGTMQTRDATLKIIVNRRLQTYAGPVAVLVDELSGSAAEIFAGGIQDLGRGRVFGTRTMGAVLPSVVNALPNGDRFQYAIASYVTVHGEVLEGRGVLPDEPVPLKRDNLLTGRDPAMDAAREWIHRQNSALSAQSDLKP